MLDVVIQRIAISDAIDRQPCCGSQALAELSVGRSKSPLQTFGQMVSERFCCQFRQR
jgi:hypothetical protein